MNELELMQTAVRKCRRIDLYLDPPPLTDEQESRLRRMQARRQTGEPVQYILGDADFMGLALTVSPQVLIPRPETEILVDTVIGMARTAGFSSPAVLDLGTGSGNIAIALAHFLPRCHVTSLDISEAALEVARQNAHRHDVSNRITFVCRDMREFLNSPRRSLQQFAIIISNPPYIATRDLAALPAEVRREPLNALDGGEDGLTFLRDILRHGWEFILPGGILALEIGDGQRSGIEHIVQQLPLLDDYNFVHDYVGTDRVLIVHKT